MAHTQLAFIGDSPFRGIIGNAEYGLGGTGSLVQLVRDRLSNIVGLGPLVSSGFIGCGAAGGDWTFSGTLDGGGASDWVSTLSTDAWDKHPYGELDAGTALLKYGSGASKVATFTASANLRYPNVGFTVYLVDYTGAGTASYSTDGGSGWTNIPDAPQNDNKIHKFHVATAITSGSTVKIRCANSAGTAQGCAPLGIEVFYQSPSTASGLTVHSLAVGGTTLHDLVASTSGDRLAWFKSAQIRLGTDAISHLPSATIVQQINDVAFVGNTTTWANDLTTFEGVVDDLGTVGIVSLYEANPASYNTTTQANYRAQTETTGGSLGAKLFDLYDWLAARGITGNAATNTAGLLFDLTHESLLGHRVFADPIYWWVRTQFLSATGPSTYTARAKQATVTYAGKVPTVAYQAGVPVGVV
jgi:hypothetical protein